MSWFGFRHCLIHKLNSFEVATVIVLSQWKKIMLSTTLHGKPPRELCSTLLPPSSQVSASMTSYHITVLIGSALVYRSFWVADTESHWVTESRKQRGFEADQWTSHLMLITINSALLTTPTSMPCLLNAFIEGQVSCLWLQHVSKDNCYWGLSFPCRMSAFK